METRTDRKTGKKISLLGFGAMRLPKISEDGPEIDEEKALAMIDYAYAHGVNYFDTAYPYHAGLSESFLGKALSRYPRESYCLADKMPSWKITDLQSAKKIFAEQLEKCRVDRFDYYLCHSLGTYEAFQSAYEKTGVLDFLREKRAAGVIGHLGFSFHGTPEDLKKILTRCDWDFTQIQLNYLDWDMQNAKKQYALIEQRGIPCTVMEPVRGGTLNRLCPEAAELLKQAKPQSSLASWAIRFAASLPNVLTVLSGMTEPEQVRDNVATMEHFEPVTEEEKTLLGRAAAEYLSRGTIPCTGCRYCMDCPSGVDIPLVFSVYNKCASANRLPLTYGGKDNAGYFRSAYEAIPEANRADHCRHCGRCEKLCPQKIRISGRMREIAELAANC
jgi:predicted aldo/keto reductase-like oxidoreductase